MNLWVYYTLSGLDKSKVKSQLNLYCRRHVGVYSHSWPVQEQLKVAKQFGHACHTGISLHEGDVTVQLGQI